MPQLPVLVPTYTIFSITLQDRRNFLSREEKAEAKTLGQVTFWAVRKLPEGKNKFIIPSSPLLTSCTVSLDKEAGSH